MLTVLLLIIFAIIDFGRLLYVSQAMKSASREGARSGVIATATGDTVFDAATATGQGAASLAGGSLAVAVNGTNVANGDATDPCPSSGSSVTVTAETPFTWFTPVGLFSSSVDSVSASTTMRCE